MKVDVTGMNHPLRPNLPPNTFDLTAEVPEANAVFDRIRKELEGGKKVNVASFGTFALRPKIAREMTNRFGTFQTNPGYRLVLNATKRSDWILKVGEKLQALAAEARSKIQPVKPKKSVAKTSRKVDLE